MVARMNNPEFQPITLWYSTLGMNDSFDFATRGYLKSLMEIKYEGLRIPPAISTSLLRFDETADPDIVMYAPLVKPAGQSKLPPLKRIEKGDPRIGTIKVIDGSDEFGKPKKMKVAITEGSIDLDASQVYARNIPSKVQCVVIHHDPSSICRNYTNLIRNGKPPGVAYVGVTVWETSSIPEAVAQILSELDLIIVPSEHARQALIESGVSTLVSVVPHTFDVDKWSQPPAEKKPSKKKYVFYSVAALTERKNLKGLMKAYFIAFEGVKDVILKIKSGPKAKLAKLAKKALIESKIRLSKRPAIRFFDARWSTDKMRAFHLDGDCFVSATRGEGFGLCELEAKLCNSRVITTNWGSCNEFIGSHNDILVSCKLVPVFGMYGIGCYEVDQEWAEPNQDALIAAMKKVWHERETFTPDFDAWERFRKKFGVEKIGLKLSTLLEEAMERAVEEAKEDERYGL
jgi:glycosyltransferase involved in cell wall biosynthesis